MWEDRPYKNVTEETLFEPKSVALTSSYYNQRQYNTGESVALVDGNTYIVDFNGTKYECVAHVEEQANNVENGVIIGEYNTGVDNDSKDIPFYGFNDDGALWFYVHNNAVPEGGACTFGVAHKIVDIKTIDPDLIGGWKALGEGEPVKTVLLDNVSVNIVDKQYEEGVAFTIREDAMCYYVTFDGTKYECKPKNSEYGVFIGSSSLWSSGSVAEGEEPFACGEYAFFAAVDGTHTVSIVCEAAEILHVPDKYLPDHLPDKWANKVYEQDVDATEDDLNALCDALWSGKYKLVLWGGMQIKDAVSRGDGSFEFFVSGTGAHDYWRKYTAGSNGIYDNNAGTYEPTQFRTAIDVGYWGRTSDGELAVFRSSYKKEKRISIVPEGIVLPSQTANSTKRFLISVDDSGTLSATEVS